MTFFYYRKLLKNYYQLRFPIQTKKVYVGYFLTEMGAPTLPITFQEQDIAPKLQHKNSILRSDRKLPRWPYQ